MTDTVRGKTLFADLSDGERYEIGIDMLINQRPEGEERNGLGTIQQRAWGEIQPKVKKQLARYAESKGVQLWTAVVTDDEELCVVAVRYPGVRSGFVVGPVAPVSRAMEPSAGK